MIRNVVEAVAADTVTVVAVATEVVTRQYRVFFRLGFDVN
jgi:hypothetical protein